MLPVLTSLSGLITGTVTDDLRKLIRAGALVNAAIWVILNVLLVLPIVRGQDLRLILALQDLNLWITLLGAFALLVLGFVLGELDDFFLSLLNGKAWIATAFPGKLGTLWQGRAYDGLVADLKLYASNPNNAEVKAQAARAAQALAMDFPDRKDLLPTRFGNVQAATSTYTWNQYGAHLGALWPALLLMLELKDKELVGRLKAHQDGLVFLATLSVLLAVVALELAAVLLWRGETWAQALWILMLVAAAYIVYHNGVQKAREWGKDARLAFDLHLDDLGETFGLQKLTGYGQETERRQHWEGFSRWLLQGAVRIDDKKLHLSWPTLDSEWFAAKPASPSPRLELVYPPTVVVCCHDRDLSRPQVKEMTAKSAHVEDRRREIAYTLVVTNPSGGEQAQAVRGCALLVSDPRMMSVPEQVIGTIKGATTIPGVRQEAAPDRPEGLLWRLPALAAGQSLTLEYRLIDDAYVEVVSCNASVTAVPVIVTKDDVDFIKMEITYPEGASGDVVLDIHGVNQAQWADPARYVVGTPQTIRTPLFPIGNQPVRRMVIPKPAGAPPFKIKITIDYQPNRR